MIKIEIKPIFGIESDVTYDGNGKIILKLFDDHIETVTSYTYNDYLDSDDKSLGKKDLLVHECSFLKKSFISNIGIGYDNKAEIYYISITYDKRNNFFNVEDFKTGKEILAQLKEWFLSA